MVMGALVARRAVDAVPSLAPDGSVGEAVGMHHDAASQHESRPNRLDVAPRNSPQPGIYRHYKGRLYQLLDVARHSETEELLAVYRCLYGDFSLWVRPLDMFTGRVTVDGEARPRFAYVGPAAD